MQKKYYKINMYNTNLECRYVSDDVISTYSEKQGYYRSKQKAQVVMLMNRLETEYDKHRKKKIQKRINAIIELYPEALI